MSRRIDGEDTVDIATHLLHRLQAEGFAVKSCDWDVTYEQVGKIQLPVGATVVVELIPVRGR